jgi:hypothetical protein
MKAFIGITLTILALNLWSTLSEAAPQACKYVSEGAVQQSWKKIRIQSLNPAANGDVLAGADNFTEAISLGQSLLNDQVCLSQVQDCRMASEGIVGGVWMKHRIQMDREMVFGADDIATALRHLSELRRLGFCQ